MLQLFKCILSHPLNRGRGARSLLRYLRWQVSSRLALGRVAVPFVDEMHLLVAPGMTGATGNIYMGLHEFQDMAFVLHLLRPGDLFVDIGANIGSYTVLAAGAAQADALAVEPLSSTYARLQTNIRLNGFNERVRTVNVGIGSSTGSLRFTAGLDTVNHVATDNDAAQQQIEVPVVTLDALVGDDQRPRLIKIDVEGFEHHVIEGGSAVLGSPETMGVIMELNGSGARYGFDDDRLHQSMIRFGFQPFGYEPETRQLKPLDHRNRVSGNTLYLKQIETVRQRVQSSRRFRIRNVDRDI